ncbi:MAG: sigma-70 family RNA polymerase sigma factor [bacterium]
MECEDTAAPGAEFDAADLREQLCQSLATLSCREETVVRMRYGIGEPMQYSLEEIGARFNLTRERIRQIEIKALRKLRSIQRARGLEVRECVGVAAEVTQRGATACQQPHT